MPKIRVLVVDDSVVMRRLLCDALGNDSGIEVVGTAANGHIALSKIPQVNPDLITMDVEMPEMNGIQTLEALRRIYPDLPVIMFSTLTERGAATTLDALALGANDYVTKPSNVGQVSVGIQRIRDELVPKIKALCSKATAIHAAPGLIRRPAAGLPATRPVPANGAPDIVAIGVSTGGPNALSVVLPQLSGNLPVPVVIVQHMPPVFTKLLAERLNAKCAIRVYEGALGELLLPGQAWIAPGNYHMTVVRDSRCARIQLNQGPPENSCRPAVDVLFRSVAAAFGSRVLGVILTGMGQDGLRGCQMISETGGRIFAQDESSSVVWGMPGYVARAGLATEVLPLKDLGTRINQVVLGGRVQRNDAPSPLLFKK